MIGNLFHLCLSKMYDETFDFESEYTNFLSFKNLSNDTGIPYQTLINLYLRDCVQNNKHLNISWV